MEEHNIANYIKNQMNKNIMHRSIRLGKIEFSMNILLEKLKTGVNLDEAISVDKPDIDLEPHEIYLYPNSLFDYVMYIAFTNDTQFFIGVNDTDLYIVIVNSEYTFSNPIVYEDEGVYY